MTDTSPQTTIVTTEPRRRGRGLRWLAVLALLLVAVLAGLVLWIGMAPASWTVRAALTPQPRDAAWSLIPADLPILVVCDVPRLLGSPAATTLRPELESLARTGGLDLAFLERQVEVLVATSDGGDVGYAAAAGVDVSPLLLPRLDGRWKATTFEGGGRTVPAVTDGATVLVPLEPGLVAWALPDSDPTLVLAAIESARSRPREPIALGDASLRMVAEFSDDVRGAMGSHAPRGMKVPDVVSRVELVASATDNVTLELVVDHLTQDGAVVTARGVQQITMLAQLSRGAGSLAALLGPEAKLLGMLPELAMVQDGTRVTITTTMTPDELRPWLAEAQSALTRER